MFICGSGSFGNQDEDHENESNGSPCPTPKRSKRSTSFCKILGRDNTNKNPYADRGLDKFYALLADLDDKKQKIYTQMGSEDISFVRFVYKNDSNHVKPIVVKLKEKNNQDKIISSTNSMIKQQQQPAVNNNQTAAAADKVVGSAAATSAAEVSKEEKKPKKKRCLKSCSESFKMENMRHPFFYFPVIVVLILLFLAVFGRSFAILCTSIGWYMMPTVVGGSFSSLPSSSNERKPKRKKEYVRRQSEKKIVLRDEPTSPKSVINGP